MMLYLVAQLVITILIDLYTILEVKRLRDTMDERRADNFGLYDDYYYQMEKAENRVTLRIQELHAQIHYLSEKQNEILGLIKAKEGVESSAFGLINAMTDFKEVETVRKSRTDEQRTDASRRKKEWWAKKREEKNSLLSEKISSID